MERIGCLFVFLIIILVVSSSEPGRTEQVWVEPYTKIEFVWVPGGCFNMGLSADEKQFLFQDMGNESNNLESKKLLEKLSPYHEVCVDGFWIGKYEVTNEQFRKFDPEHYKNKKTLTDWQEERYRRLSKNNLPVVSVSWKKAKLFAKFLTNLHDKYTFRLPTEAEWEYACRVCTKTPVYWGSSFDDICKYENVADISFLLNDPVTVTKYGPRNFNCDDGFPESSPVGSFKPNGFGLYDMIGNVSEFCEDEYREDAYKKHKKNNPINMNGYNLKVIRGGNWYDGKDSINLLCASRGAALKPDWDNDYFVGFRLVREP